VFKVISDSQFIFLSRSQIIIYSS